MNARYQKVLSKLDHLHLNNEVIDDKKIYQGDKKIYSDLF